MAMLAMGASSHIIDPNGDVDLLVHSDGLQMNWEFASTPAPASIGYRRGVVPDKTKKKKARTAGSESNQEPVLEPERKQGAETDQAELNEMSSPHEVDGARVRIRVSSKHLILASTYFRRSLEGKLAEGHALQSMGHVEIDMEGQDVDTMVLIMNLIHGRFRQVPSHVNLGSLTMIAALVDYLECHEVVEPFADKWIKELEDSSAKAFSGESIQWLCISQVFGMRSLLEKVTRIAIRQARDSIDSTGLPIIGRIEDQLNQQRFSTIEQLLSGLEGFLQDLLHDRNQCGFECNALRYGTLAKELALRGLYSPRPEIPFLGYSMEDIVWSISSIPDSPCQSLPKKSPFGFPIQCRLKSQIDSLIKEVEISLGGLTLASF